MIENEMGYRGTKSKFDRITNFVKAQRVDGNYFLFRRLRYTLMEGESSYQVKILSKRLNNKLFSILTTSTRLQGFISGKQKNFKLNPWFVSGLIDAEGTFYISIRKDNEYKLGWQIGAEFQIQLHKCDLNLLLEGQLPRKTFLVE
jgi:hypothetical protein